MRYLILVAIGAAACGGSKAPEAGPNPARGLVAFTTDDPAVTEIATTAARSLQLAGGSANRLFGGVYINGRRARLASDAVGRTTGMTVVSGPPNRTSVECRAVSSSGQSRPIQCPAAARQALPPTWTFDEVRATADSAYVGVTETTDLAEKSNCITLVRRSNSWVYLGTAVVANGKLCGK